MPKLNKSLSLRWTPDPNWGPIREIAVSEPQTVCRHGFDFGCPRCLEEDAREEEAYYIPLDEELIEGLPETEIGGG